MPRFRRTGGASGNGNGPTPQLGFLFDSDYEGPRIKVKSVPAGAPESYPIPEGNDINYRHRIERLRKYVEDKSGGKVSYPSMFPAATRVGMVSMLNPV